MHIWQPKIGYEWCGIVESFDKSLDLFIIRSTTDQRIDEISFRIHMDEHFAVKKNEAPQLEKLMNEHLRVIVFDERISNGNHHYNYRIFKLSKTLQNVQVQN